MEPGKEWELNHGLAFGFNGESHPDGKNEDGDPYWVSFEVDADPLRRFGDELMESLRKLIPGIAWG